VSAGGAGGTATIGLEEGENVTCTFTNLQQVTSTTIAKTVLSVKNADNTTDSDGKVDTAGDVINYSITYTNTGNTTLTGVTVSDPLLGTLTCTIGGSAATSPFTLTTGQAVVCTGSHTATQAEIDTNGGGDGDIDNTATGDSDQTTPITSSQAVDIVQTKTASIDKVVVSVKNADGTTDSDGAVDAAGDVINYSITYTNTGNVTLTGVTVTDSLVTLSCKIGGVAATSPFTLAPGAAVVCTGSYTVTQNDINAGGNYDTSNPLDGLNDVLRNVGTGDSNETTPITDDATVPVKADPGILTTDTLTPQDSIVLSNLTTGATGVLYVELRIDETCNQDASPAYSKTWDSGALPGHGVFGGNGTYNTANTFAVSDDATIRWCVSYSGDAHNAAIPLSDHNEVAKVDFFEFQPILTGAGFALPLLLWGLWSRRRRDSDSVD
jgi:uncharacterized repeat protein (TIGR01451 family)